MSNFFKNLKQEKLDKGLELLDSCLDDIAYARMLLTKNTHDVNWKDDAGNSILHTLVYNELCKPAQLLLKHGADPNIANKNDETPLHWCATMNSKKCAKVLIEAKCNIDCVDNSGSTPLHYAAATNNLEMIPLLLDNGASVNIMDKDGLTAIELAAEGKTTAAYAVTILLLRYYQQNNLPLPKLVKKNLNKFLSQPNPTPAVVYVPTPSHANAAAAAATHSASANQGSSAPAAAANTPLPAHLSAAYHQALREAALARVHSDTEEAAVGSGSPKQRKGHKTALKEGSPNASPTNASLSGIPRPSSTANPTRDSPTGSTGGGGGGGGISFRPAVAAVSSFSINKSFSSVVTTGSVDPAGAASPHLTMELGHVPAAGGIAGGTADDLEMYHHNSLKTIAETLFPPTRFPPLLLSKSSGSKYLDVVVAVEHCVDCETHNKLSLRHDSAQYIKMANDVLFGVIKSVIEQKFAIRLFAYRTKSTKYDGKLGGLEVTIAVNLTPQLTEDTKDIIHKNTASKQIQSRNKHASLDFSANHNAHLKVNRKMSNLSNIDHHQSGQSLLELKEDQLHGAAGAAALAQDKDYQNWATHQVWSKIDSKCWPNINFVKDKVVAFLNTTLKEHCTTLVSDQHNSDDEGSATAGGAADPITSSPLTIHVENQYKHQSFSVAQIKDIQQQYSEWVERMKLPPIVERHKLDLDWPQLFPTMDEAQSGNKSSGGGGGGTKAVPVVHCQGPMLDLELKEKAKKVDFEKAVMKHFLVYDSPKSKPAPTQFSKTVSTEILTSALARVELKDNTSSKLKVMGVKQAEAAMKAEVGFLRGQIDALPEDVLENARVNYMLDQNNKSKELQDYQCVMMGKIEAILRNNITSAGGNYSRYRIGGFDKGTYERFFKVEPARHMTKAQLTTALRRSFGNDVITSSASINKLFDSFDFFQRDQMDWRAFLYLLTILMQPYFLCDELMTWAYAIYSSVGSLDLECTDRITLGMVKDMICVPVLLSMRSNVRYLFDNAWNEILTTDSEVIQYTGRKSNFVADPDDLKITFRILQKVFTKSSFSKQLEVATVYGKKDRRQWTSVIEERYYHPIILKTIKERRREHRNDEEADAFIAMCDRRRKAMTLSWWRKFVARRNQLRIMILGCEIRIKISVFGYAYDRWKKQTMELHAVAMLQRCIRGFLGRRRQRFMYRIKNKVTLMQAGARQLLVKQKYRQRKVKLYYAAVTIQRAFRGKMGRIRVASIVKAVYDTRYRMFQKEKADWHFARQVKCAVVIQMYARRFIRRRRTMKALEQKERIAEMEAAMQYEQEQQRIATTVYRRELSAWYKERKRQRDLTALNDKQSAIQKRLILDRKNKQATELRKAKEKAREEQLEKVQEEMIELWIQRWEHEIERRGVARGKHCRNCLVLPETPEQILLKKELQKKIKKHVKEVLRSADRQKIPMEIPEAMEISTNEIIEMEIQAEKDKARAEMRAEAQQRQDEEDAKKRQGEENEKAERRRKKRWALLTIQAYARNYLARKIKRKRAYARYEKHFDPEVHEYYYLDKRTKKASWVKPLSLGSYDLDMPDNWMTIKDAQGCIYYYNPNTWEQTWDQPLGTVLCCECKEEFAKFLLCADNQCYGPKCFYNIGQKYIYEYGYNAKDITYKPFEGANTEAEYVDFYYIPEQNYFMYVLDLNPGVKLTEEEEAEEESMSIKRKASALQKSAKYAALRKCGECKKKDATLNCRDCNMIYCQSCFDDIHNETGELDEDEENYAKHNVTKIVVDKYVVLPSIHSGKNNKPSVEESEGERSKHRKHKKHKKHKKHSKDGAETVTSGDTRDSKHKKHKSKSKSKDRDRATPLVSIPDIHAKRSQSAGSPDKKSRRKRPKSSGNGSESDAATGGSVSGLDDGSVSTLGTDLSSPQKKKKHHHHHHHGSRPKSSCDALQSGSETPEKKRSNHKKHHSDTSDGGNDSKSPKKHKKKSKSHAEGQGGVVSDMESTINTELTEGTADTKKKRHKKHKKKHKESEND